MRYTYPQETVGNTLLSQSMGEDTRRVYVRRQEALLEVGEFTRGPLSQWCYGGAAHVHCVHLDAAAQRRAEEALRECLGGPQRLGIEGLLGLYFSDGARLLDELMDWLDTHDVPYGYLHIAVGEHVSYRPPRATRVV